MTARQHRVKLSPCGGLVVPPASRHSQRRSWGKAGLGCCGWNCVAGDMCGLEREEESEKFGRG